MEKGKANYRTCLDDDQSGIQFYTSETQRNKTFYFQNIANVKTNHFSNMKQNNADIILK